MLEEIIIATPNAEISANLSIPSTAVGLVIILQGCANNRRSPANLILAQELQANNLATLVVDLLTATEDLERDLGHDLECLGDRLLAVVHYLQQHPQTKALPLGLVAVNSATALALRFAAQFTSALAALVLVAADFGAVEINVGQVIAPTLLIAGELKQTSVQSSERILAQLACIKLLEVIAEVTHPLYEAESFAEVSELMASWLYKYLHFQANLSQINHELAVIAPQARGACY